MRVIDDHVKGLAEVNPLHPAAHPAEAFQPVPDLVEGQADGDADGRGRQCVGGVPSATQLQPQSQRAERGGCFKAQTIGRRLHPAGLEIRVQLDAVCDLAGDRPVDEVGVAWIVAVQHRGFRHALRYATGGQIDQPRLRLLVGLDRLMEIEVFVGDVGEGGDVVVNAHYPLQGETVGAGLDHGVLQPTVTHPRQLLLDLQRLQCGLARVVQVDVVSMSDINSAHGTGRTAGRQQHLLDHGCGCRLAVGPGDADDHQLAARVAIQRAGHQRQRLASIRNHDLRPGGPHAPGDDGGHGAVAQRRLDVAVPVRVRTWNGDEAIAGFQPPRVVAKAYHLGVGRRRLEHRHTLEEAAQLDASHRNDMMLRSGRWRPPCGRFASAGASSIGGRAPT